MPLVENVSSSRVRELSRRGEWPGGEAARPAAEVEGIVVQGDQRGRELGFPTANLDVRRSCSCRRYGDLRRRRARHAGRDLDRHESALGGVERRVEAHLLDFDGDLYGQRLVVEIWSADSATSAASTRSMELSCGSATTSRRPCAPFVPV